MKVSINGNRRVVDAQTVEECWNNQDEEKFPGNVVSTELRFTSDFLAPYQLILSSAIGPATRIIMSAR
jgi:hypothetical protein